VQPQAIAAAAAKARAVAKQEAEAKAERRKQEPVPEEAKPQQPKEVKIAEQPQPTRSKPKPEPKLKQRDRTTTAQAADPSVLWTLLETLDLSHHSEALKAAGFGDLESLGMAVPLDLTDVGLTEAEASKLLDAPARRSRSFTSQLMQSREAEAAEPETEREEVEQPEGQAVATPRGSALVN